MTFQKKTALGVKQFEEGKYVLALKTLQEALHEAKDKKSKPNELAKILTELGGACQELGDFKEGEKTLNKALKHLNKNLQPDELKIRAKAKNFLVNIYMKESQFEKAILLADEILEDPELKSCAEELATCVDQLGEIAWRKGNARQAETHFNKALTMREELFGQKGRYYGGSLGNCALILYADGRLLESEEMQKRSLQIKEDALGREHPDLICTLSNLAMLNQRLRRLEEAESLLKRSMEICQTAYGADSLAGSLVANNLGGVYLEQGKYKDALPQFENSLKSREKYLGKNNPALIKVVNNIALLYRKLGRDTDSAAMAQRAKELISISIEDPAHGDPMSFVLLADIYSREKDQDNSIRVALAGIERVDNIYGPTSIEAANMHDAAGSIYVVFKDFQKARDLFSKAVKIKKAILGLSNPDLAKSLRHLSICLSMEGDYDAANMVKSQADNIDKKNALPDSTETLMRKQVEVFRHKYGENHKTVVESLRMLSFTLNKQGKTEEANAVQKEYMERLAALHGPTTLAFAKELVDIATLAWSGQDFDKATELSARILEIFKEHEETIKTELSYAAIFERLATFYESAQENSMVEGLLKKSMEIRMQKQGATHWRVRGLLQRLAHLCQVQNKLEEADTYNEMAESIPKPSDEQLKADILEESQEMLQRIMGNLSELAKAYEQEETEE